MSKFEKYTTPQLDLAFKAVADESPIRKEIGREIERRVITSVVQSRERVRSKVNS